MEERTTAYMHSWNWLVGLGNNVGYHYFYNKNLQRTGIDSGKPTMVVNVVGINSVRLTF